MKPTANDTFIAECLETDRLLKMLADLRGDHFNVDGEKGANWAEVSSVQHANIKLREIVSFLTGGDDH